jgi:hypothetical protein
MIEYHLNIESGWYERQPQKIAFAKLPEKLKVERTIDPRIIANGAREIITGPFREKKRTFFTGVIPLRSDGWFQGNDYEQRGTKKVNSLVLFKFYERDSKLVVYYFTGYYIHSSEKRCQFSNIFSLTNSRW